MSRTVEGTSHSICEARRREAPRRRYSVRSGMRAFLALTIFLLVGGSAAPEAEYGSLVGNYLHDSEDDSSPSLIAIESSTSRTDRLVVAGVQASETSQAAPDQAAPDLDGPIPPLSLAPLSPDSAPAQPIEASLDDLCNALLTSAQDNDLPVPFFANLLWQESRLRNDAVSPVGALGIAQFMPQTALESGLDNPFDPLQAIPASARLLRDLRQQFGNLGFVAAAYNAGAHRVAEWLERRRALPLETRNYVVLVTGRSAEEWRKTPPDDAALHFVQHLPCRDMPAFADLEQAQMQQEQAALKQIQVEQHVADRSEPHPHAGRIQFARRNARQGPGPEVRRISREKYRSAEAHHGRVHRA
jgi:hypothetical protein